MNFRKYLKVYKKFLHTSLASELEYKTNILVDLITAILSLIGSIFLLSIFFQYNGSVGGCEFKHALIILGIYTILNGITNTWFNPNLTEIVKHIREGTLDFVLLKPIDSQFFISLISDGFLTKLRAIQSTPSDKPNFKSSLSFSVKAFTDN